MPISISKPDKHGITINKLNRPDQDVGIGFDQILSVHFIWPSQVNQTLSDILAESEFHSQVVLWLLG